MATGSRLLNIYTGKRSLYQTGKLGVDTWYLDHKGQVRMGVGVQGQKYKVFVRSGKKGEWKQVQEQPILENPAFYPVLFDPDDSDLAYLMSNIGRDTLALYKYRLGEAAIVDEVFSQPQADLIYFTTDRRRTELQGVGYLQGGRKTHWLKPTEPDLLARVQPRLSGYDLEIYSKTDDYDRLVVEASADNKPARYYLYEPDRDRLTLFGKTYPQLEGVPMSRVEVGSYQTRDGLRIETFLNRPAGVSPASGSPTVVIVRTTDTPTDLTRFDPLVQLLVSRGYAVLQMSIRGSYGYGRAFQLAGKRQFSRAMPDDVIDGIQWLVGQGIADPQQVCVAGHGFGGYVALMTAIRAPERVRCVISVNAPTDLITEKNLRFGWVLSDFISGPGDGLKGNMPVTRAKDIQAPVLLVHATRNAVFEFRHAKKMARALAKYDKDYRLLELDTGSDQLLTDGVRPQFYNAVVEFLAQNLAVDRAQAATPQPPAE